MNESKIEDKTTKKNALLTEPEQSSWVGKLKHRLGVESGYQFAIVMLVFSITGSTTAWLVPQLFFFLDLPSTGGLAIKLGLLFSGFVIYQLLLLFFGFLFGQFEFFFSFEKKSLARLAKLFKRIF